MTSTPRSAQQPVRSEGSPTAIVSASFATRAALTATWTFGVCLAVIAAVTYIGQGQVGFDARAYWLTGQGGPIYDLGPREPYAFLYSPAFALVVRPLTVLPWPVFLGLWMSLESAAFVWLLRPLPWRWSVPVLLMCVSEVLVGNVYPFLAVVTVVGLRFPAAWCFPLLAKITPGVGVVWFLVRREWRSFAIALGATAALALCALVWRPALWADWFGLLGDSSGSGGGLVLVRTLVALGLVVAGARTGRAWVLAPATLLASPVIAGISALTVLTALPRLLRVPRSVPSGGSPD